MSKCVICGKVLRTGRKYCHIHRSVGYTGHTSFHERELNKSRKKSESLIMFSAFALLSSLS